MSPASTAHHDDPARASTARPIASYVSDAAGGQPFDALMLSAAVLVDDAALAVLLRDMSAFFQQAGALIDLQTIPPTLARGGMVGRIGVPHEASAVMLGRRLVIGAHRGADPLSPVSRLWRGLQRRADVVADVRRCVALPGSAAERHGHEPDVVLFSQRISECAPRRSDDGPSAFHWKRARQAAELAYRTAASEQRELLLVLPVGRGSGSQRYFADALERTARQHRLPPPRAVKAGLLSALLSGESAPARWLIASVMPMDELITIADEAIGDTGPWPVLSVGTNASFFDMPASRTAHEQPVAVLLALIGMLERIGDGARARTLLQSLRLTSSAVVRMEEELGTVLNVPAVSFLAGVMANLGRAPLPGSGGDRRRSARGAAVPPPRPGARESDAVA
jgi:hypothetical protein